MKAKDANSMNSISSDDAAKAAAELSQEELQNKAQALLEEVDTESRFRKYKGGWDKLIVVFSLIWVVFQLYFTTIGTMEAITFRAYHVLFLMLYCFMIYPAYKKENRKRKLPSIFDFVCMAAAIFVFGYLILNYTRISLSGGYLSNFEIYLSVAAVVLTFLAGRRAAGGLFWLALIFLAYNFLGRYIPGTLGHGGFSLKRLSGHMFWSSQGLFGAGVGVSATYIFTFVLFGAFLSHSGFSNFINDLSLGLVGQYSGGSGKVAVVANGLMGMISGTATAIVAMTGSLVIPMMKKSGYSKEFSAGVVAAAATGGQFCPPVMGAVAFLMAEFLGVSYAVVALAAVMPAALFYGSMLCSVHFQARRSGLKGISKENLPQVREVLKKNGHLLLPIVSLLGFMFMGYTPLFACVVSIFVTIAASWIRKETRMGLNKIIAACVEGARSAVATGVCCIVIGIIVGTVSLTGLGLKFGFLMLKVVGPGELLKAGIMVAIMSTILGMGVPGIAAFVIITSVAIPVMLEVGCAPIPAYLFCLMYASLSNITPPVAISAYVASGIADSNFTKSGWIAVRVGLAGFLIPFFFLMSPELLIGSAPVGTSVLTIVRVIAGAAIGVFMLSSGAEGWLLCRSNWVERILCLVGALLLIDSGSLTDIAGLVCLGAVIAMQFSRKRNIDATGVGHSAT
ncbi:MAG: TRAP transporter permease [Christensenellales bacterium]|jgi:TRAP transporter 4TM/12TM fusion protein